MSIPFDAYISVNSVQAANPAFQFTNLITRVFSTNTLIPTGGVALEFTNPTDVGKYFGTASEEYLRSLFYFSWFNKSGSSATLMSFSRWAKTNTAPHIFGANLLSLGTDLATLQAISSGGFALTLGGVTNQIIDLDFTSAVTFADVAAVMQVAIRTHTGTQWTAATVTYNSTNNSFDFVGGDAGTPAVVTVAAPSSGEDISEIIGWVANALVYPLSPIFSNGVLAETISTAIANSVDLSTNFGSFCFTFVAALSQDNIVQAATQNLTYGQVYLFLVNTPASDATAYSAALANLGGAALTLQSPGAVATTEYPEMAPGMIMAATDYTQNNSTQNYMFQQFNLTPSVLSGSAKEQYDALGINYYGQTQSAGKIQSFYQVGKLTGAGITSNITAQNVYANNAWLTNAIAVTLMNLLLGENKVSANPQGVAVINNTIVEVVGDGQNNGTISIGNPLTPTQKAKITSITGDQNAWISVQNNGFWLNVYSQANPDDPTQYEAVYILVYKKDDVINFISGTQFLI